MVFPAEAIVLPSREKTTVIRKVSLSTVPGRNHLAFSGTETGTRLVLGRKPGRD